MPLVLAIEIRIDPNIVEVGGLLIAWHGVFTAVGITTGVIVAAMFAGRQGLLADDVFSIALWAIPGGIVGARLLFVLENLDEFGGNPGAAFAINEGGISVYGGLMGGVLSGWLYAWRRRLPIRPYADAAAFGMITGQAVGRMGDYINGEHLGAPTRLPWGFCYSHPETLQVPLCRLGPNGGPLVHPVAGVYEPLLLIGLFGLLLALQGLFHRDGMCFWVYVLGYAAIRFGLSFLRLNEAEWGLLSVPQWLALGTVALAITALLYLRRLPRRTAPSEVMP